jgi:hypothetical protein
MASTLRSSFEVILYPTRATRTTGYFSRETTRGLLAGPPQRESNFGKFRLSVTWGNEEAFTISNLGNGDCAPIGRERVLKETAVRLL